MAKKIISRSLFTLFVIALAAVPVLMVFLPSNRVRQRIAFAHDTQLLAKLHQIELSITPTPTNIPTEASLLDTQAPSVTVQTKPTAGPVANTPTITSKPTYVASIIQDQESNDWKTYTSGSLVASAFSIVYPTTWNITYKKDDIEANATEFMFVQPNMSQIMTIHVYPYASSVDGFISANYKNKLVSEDFGTIGENKLYRLSPNPSLNSNDPIYTEFGTRGLILGKQHVYSISFDSNPDHAMINLIEQIIWPTMSFK